MLNDIVTQVSTLQKELIELKKSYDNLNEKCKKYEKFLKIDEDSNIVINCDVLNASTLIMCGNGTTSGGIIECNELTTSSGVNGGSVTTGNVIKLEK